MEMTREKLKEIRKDMEKVMGEIERKHEVNFEVGSGKFDDAQAELRVKFTLADKTEEVFRQNAEMCGVDPELYGKKLKINGEFYLVKEVNIKAKKYPIIIQNIEEGVKYIFKGDSEAAEKLIFE